MKLIGNHSPYVSLRCIKVNHKQKLSITKKKKLSSQQIQLIPYHKFLQDITKINLKNLIRVKDIKTQSNRKKERNDQSNRNLNIEPFNIQMIQLQKNETFELINTEIQFENFNAKFQKQIKPKSQSEINQRENRVKNEEDDLSCDQDFQLMMTKKVQTKVSYEKFSANFFPYYQAKTSRSLNCKNSIMPSIQQRNPSEQSEKYFQQNFKLSHKKNFSYDNYCSRKVHQLNTLQKSFNQSPVSYGKKHLRNMSTGLTDKQVNNLKQRVVECIKVTPFKDSIKINLNVSEIMKNFKMQNDHNKYSGRPFRAININTLRKPNNSKRQAYSIGNSKKNKSENMSNQ